MNALTVYTRHAMCECLFVGVAILSLQYLLAMVYVYFRRACLDIQEYNSTNFFVALYVNNVFQVFPLSP